MENTNKEQDFKLFLNTLEIVGQEIKPHFFRILTAGEEQYVFRERVYCYELYHKLKEHLPEDFRYELDGELDKKGQKLFRKMRYIPDFLVHKPGDMEHNLIVIEVKQINRDKIKLNEIKDDIKKLIIFVEKAFYFRGIMLMYSDDINKFPPQLKDMIKTFPQIRNEILVMFHNGPYGEMIII